MRDVSSWVEPVLSWDKCVLLKDHNAVTPVRLEPAALRSRVKHSTTEPLRSPVKVEDWTIMSADKMLFYLFDVLYIYMYIFHFFYGGPRGV